MAAQAQGQPAARVTVLAGGREAARLAGGVVSEEVLLELAADWHLDEAFFEVSLVTIKTKAISFH